MQRLVDQLLLLTRADAGLAYERREVDLDDLALAEARDRDAGGSGLGLAIVREIVTAHGATVTVGTAELGGARFQVRFSGPPAA